MYSTNWNLAGMPPQAIRAWCSAFRYCPDPLGIVPAEVLDKLEFVELKYTADKLRFGLAGRRNLPPYA